VTRAWRAYAPLWWLAPAVVYLLAFSIYPLLYSLEVAFTTTTAGRVGFTLANFTRLVHDRLFFISLGQTVVYMGVALAVELALGLTLALLVDWGLRAGIAWVKPVRSLLLVPMLLPPVVVAVIWRLIYNPDFGVLNGTLKSWGVDTAPLTWIAGENTALLSVILVDVWQWTPFLFLLLLAALQALPVEPFEAARVDGASAWDTFRHLTLPLLKPAILVALLLRSMDLARVFDSIFILTGGGPGFATETASLFIYRTAFRFYDFGYAAVLSFVVLAATTVLARAFLRLLRRPA
jgi:multiple sugar transport system permease protein